MVAQIICMVCSLSPEPTTTEITFHKFPRTNSSLIDAWKKALSGALERDLEIDLNDTYICSRHFTSNDFSFIDGKLILLPNAIPSVFPTNKPISNDIQHANNESIAKEPSDECNLNDENPPTHGNNFASTSTINFMTISRNNFCTTSVCTETSKTMTPSIIEYVPTVKDISDFEKINGKLSDNAKKALKDNRITIRAYKRRNAGLQGKIKKMHEIFKRMQRDNLLTDSYLDNLRVSTFF